MDTDTNLPANANPATAPVNATPEATEPMVSGTATFVKVPGKFRDVEITGKMKVGDVFEKLGIDVKNCEIQRNGNTVGLDEFVQPGDTVMAVTRIRGNVYEVIAEVRVA